MALTTTQIQELDIFDNNNWDMKIDNALEKINNRILSVTTPFVELTTESKSTGEQYIPNYAPIGQVTITFLESSKLEIQEYLVNWKESIFSTATGTKEAYFLNGKSGARNGTLTMYLEGGKRKVLTFEKLRIVSISEQTFSYSEDLMIVSANFLVDSIVGYSNRNLIRS